MAILLWIGLMMSLGATASKVHLKVVQSTPLNETHTDYRGIFEFSCHGRIHVRWNSSKVQEAPWLRYFWIKEEDKSWGVIAPAKIKSSNEIVLLPCSRVYCFPLVSSVADRMEATPKEQCQVETKVKTEGKKGHTNTNIEEFECDEGVKDNDGNTVGRMCVYVHK